MTIHRKFLLIAALIACALALVSPSVDLAPSPRAADQAAAGPSETSVDSPQNTSLPDVSAPPAELSNRRHDNTEELESFQTVHAGGALASVNGKELKLGDIVPVHNDETEKTMEVSEFRSRLDRAVELELTFQAAQRIGIRLTSAQENRLRDLARNREKTLRSRAQAGLTWSSTGAAELAFEHQVVSRLMLQQNLVAHEIGVRPSSDPQLQQEFEEALRNLLHRLKSEAHIRL